MESFLKSDFTKVSFLGEGAFARVYKAKSKRDGRFVAIKKIKMLISESNEGNVGVSPSALREIRFLMGKLHPYVVSLHGVIFSENSLSLVLEYMEGDLLKIIKDKEIVLSSAQVKAYLFMMLEGVRFIHSKWILHRDIKPENVLIAPNGSIKLTDFGLARCFGYPDERQMTPKVVTRWYRSPELLFGCKFYTNAIDIWALGCVFGELLRKSPLFAGSNDMSQLYEIFCITGTPTEDSWPGHTELPDYISFKHCDPVPLSRIFTGVTSACISMLGSMLSINPLKRPEASELLKSPYFTEQPDKAPLNMLPKIARQKSKYADKDSSCARKLDL